jgi:hypothetical protein
VYLGKLQQQRKKSHISKVILRYFGYIIRQRHHNTSAASWQHLFSKFMTANITQMAKITSAAGCCYTQKRYQSDTKIDENALVVLY